MKSAAGIWLVIPVKDSADAKQRLAPVLPPNLRQALAQAMLEDVLAAVAKVRGLAGRLLVTTDAEAERLAARYGCECMAEGATAGHTGAIAAAAARLAHEGQRGMLALPGDIPLVTPAAIEQVLAAHRPPPAFTIVPSQDERGSNAVLLSPPDAVPLAFGENSFFPHLAAAEERDITPTVLRLPEIALDIDNPADLAHFARLESRTRAGRLVKEIAELRELRGEGLGGRE